MNDENERKNRSLSIFRSLKPNFVESFGFRDIFSNIAYDTKHIFSSIIITVVGDRLPLTTNISGRYVLIRLNYYRCPGIECGSFGNRHKLIRLPCVSWIITNSCPMKFSIPLGRSAAVWIPVARVRSTNEIINNVNHFH